MQQAVSPRDHPRCAEPALQPVMFFEHLLQDMQFVGIAKTFDGGHIGPVRLCDKNSAGFHGFSIHINGASAAMACFASDVGSRDVEAFSQDVDQQLTRFSEGLNLFAIDRHLDVHLIAHDFPSYARSIARSMARRMMTLAACFLKSTGPRVSSPGLDASTAAVTAALTAALSSVDPTSAATAASQ